MSAADTSPNAPPIGEAFPWALSIMMALTMFVVGSDLNIVAPLLTPIAASFHRPVASTGLLVTVFALFYALTSPLLGWMSDRVDRRRVLFGGMMGFVVLELVSAWVPSFWLLMLSRGLSGMAAAAISPTAYAMIGDAVTYRMRGRAMAIASTGFSAATIAGVPMGLWLSHWWNWRGVLVALAVLTAGVGLALFATVRRQPRIASQSAGVRIHPGWRSLFLGLRSSQAVFVGSFMAFLVLGLVYTYLSVDLVRQWHLSTDRIALLLLFYGLAGFVGTMAYGWLGDRVGKDRTVRGGQLVEAALLLSLAWMAGLFGGRTSPLPAFAALLLCFAASQSYIPNLKAMASSVPREERGRSLAWNNAAMYGGLMTGSWLGSILFPLTGFASLLVVAAMAVMVGWRALAQGDPRRQARREGLA